MSTKRRPIDVENITSMLRLTHIGGCPADLAAADALELLLAEVRAWRGYDERCRERNLQLRMAADAARAACEARGIK